MIQGVMYVQHAPSFPPKLVIPTSQVRNVFQKLHAELGHPGVSKMLEAVRKRLWWPHQHRDVVNFCQTCELCARCKNPKQMNRAPLQSIHAGFPNEIVGVDLIGPLPETPRGNKYLLVMVDYFSKWCEAVPLKTMEATTVAEAILKHWICQWGAPNQIHSDQGTSFDNALMHELCRSLGIDKTRTTAYHPQGNGQVERTNRTLKELLKAFVHTRNDWDIQIPFCLMAYRASVHSSTAQTPNYLWTGREFRLPTDARLPTIQPERLAVNEFVIRLRETILQNERLARDHLRTAQRHQKDYYDKKVFGSPVHPGDRVWLQTTVQTPGLPLKFRKQWTGPCEVLNVRGPSTYLIRDITKPNAQPMVVHFNQLKPYFENTDQSTPNAANTDDIPSVAAEVEIPAGGGTGIAPRTELNSSGGAV
ncbi:unnamed protein product [Calicophoron daubneyi]|uniref:Integrase catalytic domain-containing protein n=2 Tax=Calicophoron daubneyi TaxID=300641 RepID=A0AAV2TYC1_CALDB